MAWYELVAHVFVGAFAVNAIPHLVAGVMGQRFPTPASLARGADPPLWNAIWGCLNIGFVVGLLAVVPVPDPWPTSSKIAIAVGFVVTALSLANQFGRWRANQP